MKVTTKIIGHEDVMVLLDGVTQGAVQEADEEGYVSKYDMENWCGNVGEAPLVRLEGKVELCVHRPDLDGKRPTCPICNSESMVTTIQGADITEWESEMVTKPLGEQPYWGCSSAERTTGSIKDIWWCVRCQKPVKEADHE